MINSKSIEQQCSFSVPRVRLEPDKNPNTLFMSLISLFVTLKNTRYAVNFVSACALSLFTATAAQADTEPSCYGNCGGSAGDGKWCDLACTTMEDCADDYFACLSPTRIPTSLTGNIEACNRSGAQTYVLHVDGLGRTHWGMSNLADSWAIEIDVPVNQTRANSFYTARWALDKAVDACCYGDDQCYIVNYSAGDIATGSLLDILPSNANIIWVGSSAAASGGSEVSGNLASWIFTLLGLGVGDYQDELGVSKVRNSYNHHDTNGEVVWRIGGHDGLWHTCDFFDDCNPLWPWHTENDGYVAYHSSGGWDDDDWESDVDDFCSGGDRWSNNKVAWSCSGYDLDHEDMKMKFIDRIGW
ncbi:MAG: hypothetical protein GY847_21815 [Proteobacteria bacterium]|nr:hypothetical protein [Pseudomonadota bacterium]